MLKIAQIVLPKTGNDGEDIGAAHAAMSKMLCAEFGGFTALESLGGWIDPETGKLYQEPGITYQTAAHHNAHTMERLDAIARKVGTMAGQLAMFVVYPNGECKFIEIEESRNAVSG